MSSRRNRQAIAMVIAGTALVWGCSDRYEVIPDKLEDKVNRTVKFDQLEAQPAQYEGQLVVLGGEVLSAARLEDGTQIEVLQLPLSDNYVPTSERVQSQGRFLAIDPGKVINDPAVLERGTPVTIVGTVVGSKPGKIGASDYRYPTIAVQDMTVWNKDRVASRPYPYGAFGGYYWYPYRPYYW